MDLSLVFICGISQYKLKDFQRVKKSFFIEMKQIKL